MAAKLNAMPAGICFQGRMSPGPKTETYAGNASKERIGNMPKILKDKEMIDIIRRAPQELDDTDHYQKFLEALGDLIAEHFGGARGTVTNDPGDGLGYTCGFHINECVPADGGVYRKYDRDVTWKDGKEEQ
ncbi:MAG: hypothetical protein A2X48_23365 [Lentisphaerae bacterium GWF2_49_21]|nr:MAG: hypothetical protein A2X48_23365 [Lentisphaerae bacterium GWF2_49_21]